MALPSYEEYLNQFNSKKAEQDAYYNSIGYVKVGNEYVKNPNFRSGAQSEDDILSLENKALDNQIKKQTLKKAQGTPAVDLSADERGVLTFGETTLQKIAQLENLLADRRTDTGGTTRLYGLLRNLGLNVGNEQSIDYDTKTAELAAEYTKLLSGAAVSDKEMERLKAFLPKATDSRAVAQRKLINLKDTIKNKQAAVQNRASGKTTSGYSQQELDEADAILGRIQ